MCKCTPSIRTPYCGKDGCFDPVWNKAKNEPSITHVTLKSEVYEKLHFLDENIKSEMSQLLGDLESPDSILSPAAEKVILERFNYLEGLYKKGKPNES